MSSLQGTDSSDEGLTLEDTSAFDYPHQILWNGIQNSVSAIILVSRNVNSVSEFPTAGILETTDKTLLLEKIQVLDFFFKSGQLIICLYYLMTQPIIY